MSATTQWVKPLPVGASGSYMDTTKLFVSFGKRTTTAAGTYPFRGNLEDPDNWAVGSGWPSFTFALVRVNDGTFARTRRGSVFAGCCDSGPALRQAS